MRNRKSSKKAIALLVSIVLLVTVAVGATLAYLIDKTGEIENIFTPSKVTVTVVEEFDGNVKKNVSIQNTGDTTAFIRAEVIVTWQNEEGDVLGKAPVAGEDYTISYNTDTQTNPAGKWVEKDGYYYWNKPVAAGDKTGILITEAEPVAEAPADDYFLCIEIIASGIQSVGTNGTDSAVVDAWGFDPSTLG